VIHFTLRLKASAIWNLFLIKLRAALRDSSLLPFSIQPQRDCRRFAHATLRAAK